MPLGPEDVIRKSFKSSLFKRGYDEAEVDSFLEEVVADLRRREAEKERLLIDLQRPRTTDEVETDRVIREREQLDVIKTERQELVSELGGLQSRLTGARQEVEEAETRSREALHAQRDAEERTEEAQKTLVDLESRVARAQAIHDDLRGAYDAMVGELRGVRTEAETHAQQTLGRDPVEPVGTPQDDLAVIRDVSSSLHRAHVEAGEEHAARLRSEAERSAATTLSAAEERAQEMVEQAQARHDRLISEAKSEHGRLLSEGRTEHDRLLSQAQAEADRLQSEADARSSEASESAQRLLATAEQESRAVSQQAMNQHDKLLRAGQEEHDRLVREAQVEHARLISEAKEQRAGILADLHARREVLERRVAELDEQQESYRHRLRALVEQQLQALGDDGWRQGTVDGSGSRATAVP